MDISQVSFELLSRVEPFLTIRASFLCIFTIFQVKWLKTSSVIKLILLPLLLNIFLVILTPLFNFNRETLPSYLRKLVDLIDRSVYP